VTLQLYWTLYLGVFAYWATDESPQQEDSLAVLDQSLKLFVTLLNRPRERKKKGEPHTQRTHRRPCLTMKVRKPAAELSEERLQEVFCESGRTAYACRFDSRLCSLSGPFGADRAGVLCELDAAVVFWMPASASSAWSIRTWLWR